MKKHKNFASLLPLLAMLLLALTPTVFGQSEAPEQTIYKVGDRVEVDPQASALSYKFKKWRKATVTKIGPSGGGVFGYYVRIDAEGDAGPQDNYVMTGSNMIRALPKTDEDAANNAGEGPDKKRPERKTEPEQGQPPVANACPLSDETGGSTQAEIFKHLIQASYLHKPEAEQDYTATVTFQTFKLGTPHKWRPGVGGESPDGAGGSAGTTIYPVKAVYTVCKDHPGYAPTGYRGDIEKRQDDNTFYCFKNQFGEWQCNLGEGTIGKVVWIKK